ncbi:MAG: hypothetical protein M3Z04_12000 [Chloroflexota bacterium]|nr:hypothetical protein [Chloroflexota bacterium]
MAILTPAVVRPGTIFKWGLRLSLVGFALQICVLLLAVGLGIASFIPLFQTWAAARQTDANSLLFLQAFALGLYLPLTFTRELRRRLSQRNGQGWLARLPRMSRVLLALGFGILLFSFWFIPQWPKDLLRSAITPADQTAFQLAANLHWVRVAVINALANGLVWLGFGYQWRWLAQQRHAGLTPHP